VATENARPARGGRRASSKVARAHAGDGVFPEILLSVNHGSSLPGSTSTECSIQAVEDAHHYRSPAYNVLAVWFSLMDFPHASSVNRSKSFLALQGGKPDNETEF
jgi:hypothetical protein